MRFMTCARMILLTVACALTGCGTIYSVRVPLADAAQPATLVAIHLTIEDRRPEADRKTHLTPGTCARSYGDETYIPSKLTHLEQLLAKRVPPDTKARIELQKFDTIEYCENSARAAGASAAAGASGAVGTSVYLSPTKEPGGDSLFIRVIGQINDVPFDLTRAFDYSDLKYTNLPSENPAYLDRLRKAMEEIADEMVTKLPAAAVAGT